MILADKIIAERKKNGWSQEELADQLGVSRQAVSKWESAGSVPDLQRVIDLARVFGVSTDYLLKEEMEDDPTTVYSSGNENAGKDATPLRRISIEEANAFLDLKKTTAPLVANAVSMCIVSPVVLIVLSLMTQSEKYAVSEAVSVAVGMLFLLGLVAAAVYIFISTGARSAKYEYLEKECFETEYGITGLVKEKKNAYESTYIRGISLGVIFCILCSLPLIFLALNESADYLLGFGVAILLVMVAAGVNLMIRVSTVKESYDTLLQEGEYSRSEKVLRDKAEVYVKIYWAVITAIYLGLSFLTNRWDSSWIIWPVAGVLFAAVKGIIRIISKK